MLLVLQVFGGKQDDESSKDYNSTCGEHECLGQIQCQSIKVAVGVGVDYC